MLGIDPKDAVQTEDQRKLAQHVRSKVEEVRASANRTASEGIWMTNIAYLCGFDGIRFDTTTRSFQPVNRSTSYSRKAKLHANKILPTVQNRLARLCKNPPKYDVRPESNDTEDKEAARLGLQVLESMWLKLELDPKRIPLYMWSQQAGHGYIQVSWDPSLGAPMADPTTGEMDYEGEVRADIVSPFEIFPDPAAKSFEDALNSWVVKCKVRKLDYFKKMFPGVGELVKEEEAWLLSVQYESRINSLNSRGPGGGQESMKNSAIEMVKYEARSKEHPNGRMIVTANGITLEDKELPCGEIPLSRFDDIIIGGKYYPEAIVTHLRPIQDQYNLTIRKRAEWTSKLLAGKYIGAKGSEISQESFTDESGELIQYKVVPNAPNGGMPVAVDIPVIPAYAYNEEQALIAMFNDISGISEVSRGTLPSASIPAIGMQLLTEQDDTRIGVMTEQHEHAWARVGRLILKYVEKYYEMPRKLKMAGKNLSYAVKEVSGSDLRGNTDVVVIKGSTRPGSKTLQRQEIVNAYQQGLLGDPSQPSIREKVLGMMEFGEVGEIWEDYGLNQNQIKRGIDKLEKGEDIKAHKLDKHDMWIEALNRVRINDKFESLNPRIQGRILELIEEHAGFMVEMSGAAPQAEPDLPLSQPEIPQMPAAPQEGAVNGL